MHAVKLGMLLALIGGASVTSENENVGLSGENEAEIEDDNQDPMDHDNNNTEAAHYAPMAFQIGGDVHVDSDEDMNIESKPKRKRVEAKSNNSNDTSNQSGKAVRSRRRTQSHILLIGKFHNSANYSRMPTTNLSHLELSSLLPR